ncbi:MAG: VIT1/CCC1 transporter family protein [Candidatus Limnocylindrales bacterium]
MIQPDIAQSLDNLKLERDAIVLYEALATIEKDSHRAHAFRTIAGNERRHAEIWATKLRERGADVPPIGAPRIRIRFIVALARLFGTRAVSDLVQALEGDEEALYDAQASPEVAAIVADEREHAEIWRQLEGKAAPATGAPATAAPATGAPATAAPAEIGVHPPGGDGRSERWHRTGQSGTLRAVIFGVSDGLVSNLSLVMGVSGATSTQPGFILLAGIAGLLAGAFSMAAGEYVSMQSQRELYERQIALERAELQAMPDEEESELANIYRSKGFSADEARTIAHRIFQDPEAALETLIREELGLDPGELGSPWGAAFGSFVAFAVGAAVPVIPYLISSGATAFVVSIGASVVALALVGTGVSLITGRGALFSAGRQVVIGAVAATVTFGVGRLVSVVSS